MQTRTFYTTGKQDIIETVWEKPEPNKNEIEVKAVMTGICRSDIDMYLGNFQTLPMTMQGHEGLGIVTKVGHNVIGVKEGDYVATRGEPAFSDYYNTKQDMFVRVPELIPSYILEPVACGINLLEQAYPHIISNDYNDETILILGTGFLAKVVYLSLPYGTRVTVVGNSNLNFWSKQKNVYVLDDVSKLANKYKVIFDITSRPEYFGGNFIDNNAVIVMAAEKHPQVKTSFGNLLWKASTVLFPSPRNEIFIDCMDGAIDLVQKFPEEMSKFWTKGYDREVAVKEGFEDGLKRQTGYSRGYIYWK